MKSATLRYFFTVKTAINQGKLKFRLQILESEFFAQALYSFFLLSKHGLYYDDPSNLNIFQWVPLQVNEVSIISYLQQYGILKTCQMLAMSCLMFVLLFPITK